MTGQRIHRYLIEITDEPVIAMPVGARVLSVGPDRDPGEFVETIDLWAVVDLHAATEDRAFRVVGTGNAVPPDCGAFIGTVPSHGGALIWHVFEASR